MASSVRDTSAWTSSRIGRVPSSATATAAPISPASVRPNSAERVRYADKTRGRHLEHAELVRRAEPVLRRPKNAMRVVAIALELENAVDEMLEHARAGHRPVLRDVPDEHGRDPASLRNAKEACRSLPDLGDGAGRRSQLARVEGLDGVDHADVRRVALERRADGLELRLGEDRDVVGAAEALRAQADLRDRFLARDEECSAAAAGNRAERREEQGRLADAGLAAEQDERSRDEATPEDAVELRDAGREPSRVVDANVAEPPRGSRRTGRWRTVAAVELLHQRAEGTAPRALAEPSAGRRAACATAELDDDFGHGHIVRDRPDRARQN